MQRIALWHEYCVALEHMFEIDSSVTGKKHVARAREAPSRWLRPTSALIAIDAAITWLLVAAVLLCGAGLAAALTQVPIDDGRRAIGRVVCLHVPATWISLLLYALLVFWSFVRLTTGSRAASMMTEAIAPTGALFALLALWTGSLLSKADADLWWEWDARRLADITLLVFFVACALMREIVEDAAQADAYAAVLALVGAAILAVVLPAVALMPHTGRNAVVHAAHGSWFFQGLALNTLGFAAYASSASLRRLRCVILERERASTWLDHWRTSR